jgi:Enoyl-(Acyl carrier protein) reductase
VVVEAAGGQCLAVEVDIRNEEQVVRAVDETVKRFGGIDILVNNASAIHLTNTVDTPMKRFDLMNGVNMRGTFIWYVSKQECEVFICLQLIDFGWFSVYPYGSSEFTCNICKYVASIFRCHDLIDLQQVDCRSVHYLRCCSGC